MTLKMERPIKHEPSLVLELPPGRQAWCLACSRPWPCADAEKEE